VIAAHLNGFIALVRLVSVMQHHSPLYQLLLLLLLMLLTRRIAMRNAMMIAVRSDRVVVQHLTFGEQLATICVAPRASQTAAPTAKHLHAPIRRSMY